METRPASKLPRKPVFCHAINTKWNPRNKALTALTWLLYDLACPGKRAGPRPDARDIHHHLNSEDLMRFVAKRKPGFIQWLTSDKNRTLNVNGRSLLSWLAASQPDLWWHIKDYRDFSKAGAVSMAKRCARNITLGMRLIRPTRRTWDGPQNSRNQVAILL